MATQTWLDTAVAWLAPGWGLRRTRARLVSAALARHYEAAAAGRRTAGWHRSSGDANAVLGAALSALRQHARDLVRNNPYATAALDTIVDHTVGWGIDAKPARTAPEAVRTEAARLWRAWAWTTACDADGRLDLAGLEQLVLRTVAEAGECLVRRRLRRPEDGLPIPLQLQVLEPDFLDTEKDGLMGEAGGPIIQGVEFDAIGRRVAYWLYREHPGAAGAARGFGASERIPASGVLHVFRPGRPGQVRGPSWFAPVILRLKSFDEYEDATLLKQIVAACFAGFVTDMDGLAPPTGAGGTTMAADGSSVPGDRLEPGMLAHLPPGKSVTFGQPPSVTDHASYAAVTLHAIASGLGVTYEDVTGDFSGVNFSSARMARLKHWARVEGWRWRMLVPQFCDPVWRWAMQAAAIAGRPVALPELPAAEWTAPPMPMIEPDKEGLAIMRNIRAGITTLPEEIRARGYDPDLFLDEYAAANRRLDALGIILDSDPRRTTQAGNPREASTAATRPADDDEEAGREAPLRNGAFHA